ncbi:MAG: ribokinase [Spirochaetales bacterium]|nr:ribokinase [Spirochaetales bacterium]
MSTEKTARPVCVTGSLNLDLVCVLDRLPATGETLTARSYTTAFGGKGANQAVAVARLGGTARMIGAVGADDAGRSLRANLEENGVDAAAVLEATGPSGVAMIHVDAAGDNTIVVYQGANALLTPAWVRRSAAAIESSACLVLQLEIPLECVLEAARIAAGAGVPVLLNPAPARELPDELLSLCSIVSPNETELGILAGASGLEAGARALLARGVGAVVVTLGSRGCLYVDGKGSFEVPSFQVDAVDATAAGDSFNGALATMMAADEKITPDALAFCNAAGALAATTLGAQPSIPYLRDVQAFLDDRRSRHQPRP